MLKLKINIGLFAVLCSFSMMFASERKSSFSQSYSKEKTPSFSMSQLTNKGSNSGNNGQGFNAFVSGRVHWSNDKQRTYKSPQQTSSSQGLSGHPSVINRQNPSNNSGKLAESGAVYRSYDMGSKSTSYQSEVVEHTKAYSAATAGSHYTYSVPNSFIRDAMVNSHMAAAKSMTFAQLANNTISLKAGLKALETQHAQAYSAYQETTVQVDAKKSELARQYKEEFAKCSSHANTLLELQESLMEKHHAELVRNHKKNCDTLEQLKEYTDICKKCIAYNESCVKSAHETIALEMTKNYAPSLQKVSNQQLEREVTNLQIAMKNIQIEMARDVEAIKYAIGVLEKAKAEGKKVILINDLKKSVEIYERETKAYSAKLAIKEKAALLLQAKLDYAGKELTHRVTSLNEYAEIQEAFAKLDEEKLSILDLTMVKAIRQTVADDGQYRYKNEALTKEEVEILQAFNISPDSFALLYGEKGQMALYEAIRDTVKAASDVFANNKDNKQVKEYVHATLEVCERAAIEVRAGSPKQALALAYMAKSLEIATAVASGVTKGLIKGLAINVVSENISTKISGHVPYYHAIMMTMTVLNLIVNRPDFGKLYESMQKMTLEKQVELITEIVVTFAYNTKTFNSYLNNKVAQLQTLIKKEAAALQALATVESTTLVTIKGITVSEKVADQVRPLIESGQLANGADVANYLRGANAPFITAFKEAIEVFAEKLGKATMVEQNIASEIKTISEKAETITKVTETVLSQAEQEIAAWEASLGGKTSLFEKAGNVIKEFLSETVKAKWRHVFSDKHLAKDILKLGKDKTEIMNKFIVIIKAADAKNLLNKEGVTRIETAINSYKVTVSVFVESGKVMGIDGFVGHSARQLGTIKLDTCFL